MTRSSTWSAGMPKRARPRSTSRFERRSSPRSSSDSRLPSSRSASTLVELRRDALTGAVVAVNAQRQARPNRPNRDCPFCVGGLEAPDAYDVRAFVNRWPSFDDAQCEVVLYTPAHDATFWSL